MWRKKRKRKKVRGNRENTDSDLEKEKVEYGIISVFRCFIHCFKNIGGKEEGERK